MGRAAFAALIPGYGVPRDLFKDVNYRAYLSLCFNALFEKYRDARGTIVLSGGATDCFRPYRRTEAHEMRRWFQHQKALTEKIIKKELRWKLVEDRKALTTVENILYFGRRTASRRANVIIFVEQTRANKMKIFSKQIFKKRRVEVLPIDFDISSNRYRTQAALRREKTDLKISLHAIHDPSVLKFRRKIAKEKIGLLRQYGPTEGYRRLPKILDQLEKKYANYASRKRAHQTLASRKNTGSTRTVSPIQRTKIH